MTAIDAARIRALLDSRGNPTVEVELRSGSLVARFAAPSGASTGTHEAQAFPPGGVEEAVRIFRSEIARRVQGRDVADQAGLDAWLRELDGSRHFSRIGGNVAVAVSLANARLAAAVLGQPLYRLLGGAARRLPLPLGNVIGGGRHAIGGTTIQEYLVVSQGRTMSERVFANARVHQRVRDALAAKFPGQPLGRGDEGAWVAPLRDEEALALLADVCREAERDAGFPVRPAVDLAASEFYRDGGYRYRDRLRTREEQIDFVEQLVRKYGLFSVEDPFDQEDFEAFAELTKRVGDRCTIIGDDLFATDVERLRRGIERRACNAILIKPNQIGTLSDTRAAVDLAHRSGYATVMSHRSGETTDDAIAHLAVGLGCLGIKTGAVGGERVAKLNELIRIEEELQEGA
jgi:enolase